MAETKRKMHTGIAVIKTTADIRLSKVLAGAEARKDAKEATITLKQFIKEEYPREFVPPTNVTAFKCTIRDIGLFPFEIDIYDARIILVEVTGKLRKDFDGNEVPERIYRGRHHNVGSALKDIADIMSMRKIMSMESTVITLRDYANSYATYNKYLATVVNPAYAKALDAIQDKFPFTQISEGRDDEENWFKK